MREAAAKTIEEHELVLPAKEQQIFVDMLMNPPKPNDSGLPIEHSSTSTLPLRMSRPSLIIARRNLGSQVQAVS